MSRFLTKLAKVTNEDLMRVKTRDFSIAKGKITEHADSFDNKTENIVGRLLMGNRDKNTKL